MIFSHFPFPLYISTSIDTYVVLSHRDESAASSRREDRRDGGGGGGGSGKPVDTSAFRPDKDFAGVDRSKRVEPRGRPVEFEREAGYGQKNIMLTVIIVLLILSVSVSYSHSSSMAGPTSVQQPSSSAKAADPFGDIDAFLKEAKS